MSPTPIPLWDASRDPAADALRNGGDPLRVVPNEYVIVRGGQSPLPPPGSVFSASLGATAAEAASGVPHNSIRATTAGHIRRAGGTVELAPEPTPGGVTNYRHVHVTEAVSAAAFTDPPVPNPVPKADRIR